MAGSINFKLSPSVLEWARTSMGYSIDQAAKKAGVQPNKYLAWERGEKLPTYKQLEGLAENVYKRPIAILLLAQPPLEESIQKDFRNLSNKEIENISPELRLIIRKAKRYQLILEEVTLEENPAKFNEFKVSSKDDPQSAAKRFREFLNLPLAEQKSWNYDDAFKKFKQKIESIGIYVFQIKMQINEVRALCLTGEYPLIVLNTDDSNNGRIFSIFHETCHILFNTNDVFRDADSGTLNIEYRIIEEFCNKFSAAFLVPEESFEEDIKEFGLKENKIKNSDIEKLARIYNVSKEVIARKLLSLQLISETDFWKKKRLWDASAKSAKEAEKEKMKKQDPKGIDQGIKIIYEKGRPYVSNVINAYNQGLISSSDLSNYLEIKLDHLPKIIQRLNN